jgi:hypothetical protein
MQLMFQWAVFSFTSLKPPLQWLWFSFFIPKSSLYLFGSQISVYASMFYQNPNYTIKNLVNLIDPLISLYRFHKDGSNGSPNGPSHAFGQKGSGKKKIKKKNHRQF